MKTITTTITILLLAFGASAQIVKYSFNDRWNDPVLKTILLDGQKQYTVSLTRIGFTNADTIDVYFNQQIQYQVVWHNLRNIDRAEALYGATVLHASNVRNLSLIKRNQRLEMFRLYVQMEGNRYQFTEYETLQIPGRTITVRMKEFRR